ncbi:alpha/beta hydrolase [Aspergillus floccosus]
MTKTDKINVVDDDRVQRKTIRVNDKTYGYLVAEPATGFSHTVFLIFQWDGAIKSPSFCNMAFVWFALTVLDMGDQWDSPSESLSSYSLKSQCQDFHDIAEKLGCRNIIVGGHDWGAMFAYRFALYFPEFVTHLITFVVPYIPPSPEYVNPVDLAKTRPSFGYQTQLGSEKGIIEANTQDKDGIYRFLNTVYGGSTSDGKHAFSAVAGVDFAVASQLSRTKLLDAEEMQYYVDEYARNGLQGPCNYYRTHHLNFLDELVFFTKQKTTLKAEVPALFIRATRDTIITSTMVDVMVGYLPQLTVEDVDSSHWILWERPERVNGILKEWLQQQQLIK